MTVAHVWLLYISLNLDDGFYGSTMTLALSDSSYWLSPALPFVLRRTLAIEVLRILCSPMNFEITSKHSFHRNLSLHSYIFFPSLVHMCLAPTT